MISKQELYLREDETTAGKIMEQLNVFIGEMDMLPLYTEADIDRWVKEAVRCFPMGAFDSSSIKHIREALLREGNFYYLGFGYYYIPLL